MAKKIKAQLVWLINRQPSKPHKPLKYTPKKSPTDLLIASPLFYYCHFKKALQSIL